MSGFLRNVILKTTFDGDDVVLKMTPLNLQDVLTLRTKHSGVVDQEQKWQPDTGTDLLPLMLGHLVGVEGLTAADGSAVSTEEVLANAYFTQLIVAGSAELIKRAYPQNPKPPAP